MTRQQSRESSWNKSEPMVGSEFRNSKGSSVKFEDEKTSNINEVSQQKRMAHFKRLYAKDRTLGYDFFS